MTYDFQQKAAMLQIERERQATKEANKELKELKDGLPEMIKAEVTRALVADGVIPDPSPEGGAPTQDDEDWRKNPSISRGLEKRMRTPVIDKRRS